MQINLKIQCADCGQEMDIESIEVTLNDFMLEVAPCPNCPSPTEPSITIPVPQGLD